MANTKISQLTPNTNPTGNEELVYAFNNTNGKMTLNTMKTFSSADSQATLVSGVNIKTINNQSILGSGNLDVSGGGGGGGFEPTELGGDANIWELSEGAYVTDYKLYYSSGNAVNIVNGTGAVNRQMIFVTEASTGGKAYFVYNVGERIAVDIHICHCGFGKSISSSNGEFNMLGSREWALKQYIPSSLTGSFDSLNPDTVTQIVKDMNNTGANAITIDSANPPYPGLTYTILINSVASAYDIQLGTGVTNPFGITLPNESTKKCVITVLITSTTTGIITGCTIEP